MLIKVRLCILKKTNFKKLSSGSRHFVYPAWIIEETGSLLLSMYPTMQDYFHSIRSKLAKHFWESGSPSLGHTSQLGRQTLH